METEKSMRLFHFTRQMFAKLGFIPNDNQHHFNKHHVQNIAIAVSTIVSQFVYVCTEATTIDRYMHSYFMATVIIGISMSYVKTIFKTTELYDFIENFEKITKQSEYNSKYYLNQWQQSMNEM